MKKNKAQVIGSSDQVSEEDLLGMKQYFDGIAAFVKSCDTPMTVAIQGDWGSGKTTAMQQVRDRLKDTGGSDSEEEPKNSIWFNTWQFAVADGSGKLIVPLLHMLIEKLSGMAKDEKKVNVARAAMRSIAALIGAGIQAHPVGGFIWNTAANMKSLSEPRDKEETPEQYMARMSEASRAVLGMKDTLRSLVEDVVGEDGRLYVFVDDLDRLEPQMAVELLEGLKNFMDCEGCVFILAVDLEVVEQGLSKKYGADFSEEKAHRFFDKIIQVPFELPMNAYDLTEYVQKQSGTKDVARYLAILRAFDERNPRTIKRGFNLLKLYECVDRARSGGVGEGQAEGQEGRYGILLLQKKMKDVYDELDDLLAGEPAENATAIGNLMDEHEEVRVILEKGFGIRREALAPETIAPETIAPETCKALQELKAVVGGTRFIGNTKESSKAELMEIFRRIEQRVRSAAVEGVTCTRVDSQERSELGISVGKSLKCKLNCYNVYSVNLTVYNMDQDDLDWIAASPDFALLGGSEALPQRVYGYYLNQGGRVTVAKIRSYEQGGPLDELLRRAGVLC